VHTVSRAETLAQIALRYDVPFELIAADNKIADPNKIRTGQELEIYPRPAGTEVIQGGATLADYAHKHGCSVNDLMKRNPQISNPDRILAGGLLRV
jgi:LysM repeat protein